MQEPEYFILLDGDIDTVAKEQTPKLMAVVPELGWVVSAAELQSPEIRRARVLAESGGDF